MITRLHCTRSNKTNRTPQEIAICSREINKNAFAIGYQAVVDLYNNLLKEVDENYEKEGELRRYVCRSRFSAAALFACPVEDMESYYNDIQQQGRRDISSQILMPSIFAAWCEDSMYLERAKCLVCNAHEVLLNSKDIVSEEFFAQELKLITGHFQKIETLSRQHESGDEAQ